MTGSLGSGNGTLSFLVRQNTDPAARTSTITLNGQTLTINQDAAPATIPSLNRLSYKVVSAEYSKSLEKIVAISTNPDELHVYDPLTGIDRYIALSAPPLSVSVRPDGLYAAVGHSNLISYINLQTLVVEKVFPVSLQIASLALAGNGWVYGFPPTNYNSSSVVSVQISTGGITTTPNINPGVPRITPDVKYLYVAAYNSEKLDISQGAAKNPGPLVNNPGFCGNLWLSEDGIRLFTGCAKVTRTSDNPSLDLQPAGGLAAATNVSWATHSLVQQSTAVLPTQQYNYYPPVPDEVQFYGDASLALTRRYSLPSFSLPGGTFVGHGKFVFWNSAASKLFVIEQADTTANLLSDFAVATISSSDISTCTYSFSPPSASVPGTGGTIALTITTGANCDWSLTSDVSWISAPDSLQRGTC